MVGPVPPTRNQARAFELTELFFSVTDAKGIIRFGNDVFTRISGYTEAELLGAPHNIIRHPDMPRAAFKLLWSYLQAGKTVAAYVKNRAQDGCYYWVLALVMPCEEGYLSIRLKPTSPFFDTAQEIYTAVRAAEKVVETASKRRKEAVEVGVEKLQGLLMAKGFETYDDFMWAALRTEMTSREAGLAAAGGSRLGSNCTVWDANLGQHPRLETLRQGCAELDGDLRLIFTRIGELVRLGEKLLPKSEFVLELADSIHLLSLNAALESTRLDGETGRTLSVVADQIGQHTAENTSLLTALHQRMKDLTSPLGQLLFNIVTAKLQIEMALDFIDEILTANGGISIDDQPSVQRPELWAQVNLLLQAFCQRIDQVLPALELLRTDLLEIQRMTDRLQKFVRNLQFIQFLGQVEAARSEKGAAFKRIFEKVMQEGQGADHELGDFKAVISANLAMVGRMKQTEQSLTAGVALLRQVLDQGKTSVVSML